VTSPKYSQAQTGGVSFIAAFTIVFCAYIIRFIEFSAPVRLAIALIPVIPTGVLVWVMARAIFQLDELQRKIQLEGLALAFAGTCFATMIYGMLLVADVGLPHINPLYIYVLMIALYGIGTIIAGRRYR
jgi:hypothetical protein